MPPAAPHAPSFSNSSDRSVERSNPRNVARVWCAGVREYLEGLISTTDTAGEPSPFLGQSVDLEGEGGEDRRDRAALAAQRRTWRIRGGLADRLEVVVPIAVYGAASLTGATTSSLGMLRANDVGDVAGQFGSALAVRSDEWLTAAPIELATLANGASMTNPLSQSPDLIYQVSSGHPFESLLFLDGNLLRLGPWLPDAMLFAAFRGFPWLLLALSLPPLLRRMGATRGLSWLATALCFLAPASLWWSFMPIRILGFAAAGSYLLMLARDRLHDRRNVTGLLLAALSGLLLARLVTFYVPWSLTVGLPLVAATGCYLLWDRRPRGSAWFAIGAGALFGAGLLALVFREQWAALHAELNTLYPGQRRLSGGAMPAHQLLGAPGLAGMDGESTVNTSNQSEISSAYLICGVVTAFLWPSVRRGLSSAQRAAIGALAVATLVWVAWCAITWGSWAASIPGLSAVVPQRAAQTVGYPATLLMCLVLAAHSRVAQTTSGYPLRRLAAVAGLAAALLTGYGVSDLQRMLPGLGPWQLWASIAITGAAAFLLVRYPRHWAPVVAVCAVAAAVAVQVNPVIFGLGEVRNSPAADRARQFSAQAKAGGYRFATDSMLTNALLVANGVPMFNGYQVTGPVRAGWREVDPTGQYEAVWNRGASYLLVTFTEPPGAAPEVVELQGDIILIKTDPCWLARSSFDVARIIAGGKLDSPCARQIGQFEWAGGKQRVYALEAE